ncbi:MAG: 1-deoxy-D-xylulose-5-phosphate reductoisomerase, partial [Clostridiales bacterium]|nr:1-deoxy-D-xylulose-5-phosphate reductoisomerase [Clostridiales bacterium]
KEIQKILLTASGGPFLGYQRDQLEKVELADALKHPRWNMGKKVTIDSATLMNKGLEVIEAKWLFDISTDKIEVLIHPQSIVHSMVQFIDGSILAQLGATDMRLPILYAFTWPNRRSADLPTVDFPILGKLSFEEPNTRSFPCLQLAYEALRINGTMPAVLNAANEVAVEAFLKSSLSFTCIPRIVEKAMAHHKAIIKPTLEDILLADKETRDRLKKDDIL